MLEGTVTLADGRALGYAEYGDPDGRPIVHFHGMPGGRSYDLDHDALLAQRARLLTVERPGIGLSDPMPDRTLHDWPADVAEFGDLLGLDRFAVLGTSAGGPYAFACAVALGDRVTRLGLRCALGPAFDHPEFDAELAPQPQALLPLARADREAAAALVREVLGDQDRRWAEDPAAYFDEFVQTAAENDRPLYLANRERWERHLAATHGRPGAFAADAVIVFGPWDLDLSSIRVPVRAFHGTDDRSAPFGLISLAVKEAGGEVVAYEGDSHYLQPHHDDEIAGYLVGDARGG